MLPSSDIVPSGSCSSPGEQLSPGEAQSGLKGGGCVFSEPREL